MSVLRQLFAVIFFALLLTIVLLKPHGQELTPYTEAVSIAEGAADFNELSDRFEALAREKGGVYAYEVLQRASLPPNVDLHLLGHVVGDELYKEKGVAGIADCTQNFRNACSHAMVIGALNEYGPSEEALRRIDETCHSAPGGMGAYTMCYHGLGHGVFAYLGYDLAQTVAFCKKMGTAQYQYQQFTQCVGGAIMELMGGGGHDHEKWLAARERYLPRESPLAPCDSTLIPDVAKTFCYAYLTPRLFELAGAQLAMPDPATFSKAFSFCDAIPKSAQILRDSCFGGFGKEFIGLAGARDIRAVDSFSDDTYILAAHWCDLSPVEEGTYTCLQEELESIFWGGENDPAASFRFCSLVRHKDSCLTRLSENINRYFEGERREKWCAQLPLAYQHKCVSTL